MSRVLGEGELRFGTSKTGLNPSVIITERPKAILLLRFHLLYVRYFSTFKSFKVLILTLLKTGPRIPKYGKVCVCGGGGGGG